MKEIWSSVQFQYSLFQAELAAGGVLLASAGAYFMGDFGLKESIGGFLIGMIPILARLKEGVGDANRASSGDVIPSDVPAGK